MRISDWSSYVCSSDIIIILVLAKTRRVGTDRVKQKRSVDFLTGMACLLETAADVIAVLVHSGTKACIDAADDPGPIVRAGCRSIDKVAIRKHGRWQQIGRASCRERVCQYV